MPDGETQYRPPSVFETNVDDALSVRFLRDMQDGLNNAKYHALRHPLRAEICFPPWEIAQTWTGLPAAQKENLVACFAPVWVPEGFSRVQFTACVNGGTWKLYLVTRPFGGAAEPMLDSYVPPTWPNKGQSPTFCHATHASGTWETVTSNDCELILDNASLPYGAPPQSNHTAIFVLSGLTDNPDGASMSSITIQALP